MARLLPIAAGRVMVPPRTGAAAAPWGERAAGDPEAAALATAIEAARRGDRDAFAALVRATQRVVHVVLRRTAAGAAEVDDLAQETYARVWQGLDRLRDPDAATAFVCAIARHVATDAVRRRGVARRAAPWLLDAPAPAPVDDAGAQLDAAAARALVAEALATLAERHRAILILREVDALSYGELAAVLAVRPGTVESRLFRARAALARALGRAARRRGLDPETLEGRP
jgi:RNA polymerase sigma-70 factor (ECF subfamily)